MSKKNSVCGGAGEFSVSTEMGKALEQEVEQMVREKKVGN